MAHSFTQPALRANKSGGQAFAHPSTQPAMQASTYAQQQPAMHTDLYPYQHPATQAPGLRHNIDQRSFTPVGQPYPDQPYPIGNPYGQSPQGPQTSLAAQFGVSPDVVVAISKALVHN